MSEKNSFGFATPVYGQGMVVTHTYDRVVIAIAEQRMEQRGRMVGAVSEVLRFSDGRWREMSHAEKINAIHDEGETHMQDECGRCAEMEKYRADAREVLEQGVKS
jgi:hypothetical protein